MQVIKDGKDAFLYIVCSLEIQAHPNTIPWLSDSDAGPDSGLIKEDQLTPLHESGNTLWTIL